MRANELEQTLLSVEAFVTRLGEARGDHAESADAGPERLVGGLQNVLARQADDYEVDRVRDLRDGGICPHAGDRLLAAVDRVGRPGKVRAKDVPKELAADRAVPRRSADDGHGPGREERSKRCGDRDVVAAVDEFLKRRCRGERQAHLDYPSLERTRCDEACIREHPEHRRVRREDLGEELLDARCRSELREALEQSRADPSALEVIGDREGDFGGSDVSKPDVASERDDLVLIRSDESAALGPVGIDHRGDGSFVDRRLAVET